MATTLLQQAEGIAKTLNTSTQRMIEANERLAQSNEKQARTATCLTIALLIFAAVEAIATAVSALK